MSDELINDTIKNAKRDAPQITLYEFVAWIQNPTNEGIPVIDIVIPESSKTVKKFVMAISDAENAF